MRRIFLIIALVAISSTTVYGQRCKAADTYNDTFAGIKYDLWGTKIDSKRDLMRGTNNEYYVYLSDIDGNQTISFSIVFTQRPTDAAVNTHDFEKGTVFRLRTQDNQILEFTSERANNIRRKVSRYQFTTINLFAQLSEEDLIKLTESEIAAFQVTPDGGETLAGEVRARTAQRFKAQVVCFKNL